MDGIIQWVQANWAAIIAVYLAIHKLLVAIRDVLDKTPASDDNWFERAVTIFGKLGGYLITGVRPK